MTSRVSSGITASAEDDPLDPPLPPLVRDVHPLVRIAADQADADVPRSTTRRRR